ncbi:MAG TPA: NAD-dependent epimerase/dehydratase family protein [Gaiellaceae bacterium]|nr:NAD-dependent epimerase/dehydratase family protein [Gaiellaceae bacterium]
MRAIVTGGAGFIGSHVVDALVSRGDEVTVIDDLSTGRRERVNAGARLVVADVREAEQVERVFDEAKPDVCFHLAAQADVRVSVERPVYDLTVNGVGTVCLLVPALRHGSRVVLASTGGAIYGECPEPARETAPRMPLSPYGASKLAAEEYLTVYNRLHGTGHVALRYGNVYGPRQDPHGEAGVVAIFLGRLAAGESPHVFGDGTQERDYVFVADVVEATLAAAGHEGVFNVGTGTATSVLGLLQACLDVSGVDVEPVFDPPRLGELQRSVLDTGLAERELGFRARTALTAGIGATWEFSRAEGVGDERAN